MEAPRHMNSNIFRAPWAQGVGPRGGAAGPTSNFRELAHYRREKVCNSTVMENKCTLKLPFSTSVAFLHTYTRRASIPGLHCDAL